MSFGEIVNYLLYALSGFCFGIFASRYSVLAAVKLAKCWREEGFAGLASCLPQLLFIFCAFFLFPTWFITRTQLGGYCYYIVLLLFFTKGYRRYVK